MKFIDSVSLKLQLSWKSHGGKRGSHRLSVLITNFETPTSFFYCARYYNTNMTRDKESMSLNTLLNPQGNVSYAN